MMVELSWCAACQRKRIIRTLQGSEALAALGQAGNDLLIRSFSGAQLTVCATCKTAALAVAWTHPLPPQLAALVPITIPEVK